MASYKQTVLDIEDFISFEIATIEHIMETSASKPLPIVQRENLQGQEDAYKAIQSIIKENGKETK